MRQWVLRTGATDASGLEMREVPAPLPGPGATWATGRRTWDRGAWPATGCWPSRWCWRLTRAPATLSLGDAATLPCSCVTAWHAAHGARWSRPGDRVFLRSGGVALMALDLARAAYAKVVATTRDPAKADRLRALGATVVVDSSAPSWGQAVLDRTGGVGKVVGSIGAGVLNECLAALRYGGEVAVLGLMDAPGPPDLMALMGKGASVRGVAVGPVAMHLALTRFIDAHGIKPTIGAHIPFHDAPAAYAALAAPDPFGKIVIDLAEGA